MNENAQKRAPEIGAVNENAQKRAPVIGIDLGTTFSLGAVVGAFGPYVIPDAKGRKLLPSVVCFPPQGEAILGFEAREKAVEEPEATVYSVKRLMGKGLEDLARELSTLPYAVVETDRKLVKVRIRGSERTPQELSAMILREIRDYCSKALGEEVRKAVITVPAYFDDAQRQATRDAGRIAGLEVQRIVNEPTAAALAYGLDRKKDEVIAVYDLGGGTFDISILRIQGGVFQVLATNGDTYLGGDDLDREILSRALDDLAATKGDEVRRDPHVLQALRLESERVKIALSAEETATLAFRWAPRGLPDRRRPEALHEAPRGIDYRRTFARAEFEAMAEPWIERSFACVKRALKDAALTPAQIGEVVLVGGSTRIPLVRRKVEAFFSRKPHTELNPDEVVALGAAVQASILQGGYKDILLLDVIPLSLGIETMGGAVAKLVLRNSTVPARATEEFTTFVDNQTAIVFNILQGERELAKDCRSLGQFKLRGIPPMPAGMPRVEVTFQVDQNGILTVSAIEQRSGTRTQVEVIPVHGLTEAEVRKMVLDSIEHAREDLTAHRLIDLRNEAETVLRAVAKGLEGAGAEVAAERRAAIDEAAARLQALLPEDDADATHKALDALNAAAAPLAELLLNRAAREALAGKKLSEV